MTTTQRHSVNAWSPAGWPSERPSEERSTLEAWCYTDRYSYRPGDRVDVHVHTTAASYDVEIVRDGAEPETVYARQGLDGVAHETPEDAYASGCGWPVAFSLEVPDEWRSGFYILAVRATSAGGQHWEREHFFVVRAAEPGRDSTIALVLTTSTMIAYNDWGGANHYRGLQADFEPDDGSPLLSIHRPIGRGMIRKPVGAPRESHAYTPPPFWAPTYDAYSWARLHGYSRHHADAFWATYERPFVVWAERAGYQLEYLTQHDLDEDVTALDPYGCAVMVGHDEYWSWEMRDAIDRFVERGGGLAHFAGNFAWQVRLEQDRTVQACYRLPALDPLAAESPRLATTFWDVISIGRPGAETMGLTGSSGVYNRYGVGVPRSSGGYTIYRPEHWSLAGTDLYYGDVLGPAPICVAAFELDSIQYTFHRGLPYPTFEDGAPATLEIIGLAPAVAGEEDRFNGRVPLGGPLDEGGSFYAALGDDWPEYLRDQQYGAGMMATFTRGAGAVFNAGTTEWVNGLIHRDPFTEQITRNVLDRLSREWV